MQVEQGSLVNCTRLWEAHRITWLVSKSCDL